MVRCGEKNAHVYLQRAVVHAPAKRRQIIPDLAADIPTIGEFTLTAADLPIDRFRFRFASAQFLSTNSSYETYKCNYQAKTMERLNR